jgi:hypothetical protein
MKPTREEIDECVEHLKFELDMLRIPDEESVALDIKRKQVFTTLLSIARTVLGEKERENKQ